MLSFETLYQTVLNDTLGNMLPEEREKYIKYADTSQLDCLLNPSQYAPILRVGQCDCDSHNKAKCAAVCPFSAITGVSEDGIDISSDKCVGCYLCVDNCKSKVLTASKDIIPALRTIASSEGPVYALVAPAFLGQFSEEVTPGKLRTALKAIGFDGMIEVSLFADVLTLKEALEFSKHITTKDDFQLTSCCCPIWIAMIRKIYSTLLPHIPGSVSPMVAAGRAIKVIHPDATTIFIGPCVAKKSEAREADVADAIDFVLTFQEINDVFEALQLDIPSMEESEKDHSSWAGRVYARSGGVSEAVSRTLEKISPEHPIKIKAVQADGVAACKAMVNDLLKGEIKANFYEGMGCKGGCVGGPKAIIDREQGRFNVERYGEGAVYKTPIDNPFVIELLERLGFDTVESLLSDSEIFTRRF